MEDRSGVDRRLVGGRYRLGALLGEGGMGSVWRATDEMLGREVAVKRVRFEGLPAREVAMARERMLREARIAARLLDPHVVTIFDVVDEGGLWLVLEYVPSRSLAEVLDESGPLVARDVALIGAQIAGALAEAHARGIVHRDVKPANVLLVEDGSTDQPVVKVTDWGISRIAGGPELTGTNIVSGTPAYFAPEIARGTPADARSDVYALGATLFELLEGRPPFGRAEGNVFGLLARIAGGAVPAAQRRGALADAIGALIDPDPARRPSARQARRLLARPATADPDDQRQVATGTADPVRPALPLIPVAPGAGPPPERPIGAGGWWRRRWVAAAAGVLVICAGAVTVLVVVRGEPARSALPALGRVELGDPRTADPCSLVDEAALRDIGTTDPFRAFSDFGSCIIDVDTPAGAQLRLDVEFVPPVRPNDSLGGTPQQLGDVTLIRYTPDADLCRQVLVLADRYRIFFDAITITGSPPADLCPLTDAATRAAVDRLASAGIGRRVPPDVDYVLPRLDACSLLTAPELAVVPALDPARIYPGYGGWLCHWDGANDRSEVLVEFGLDTSLTAESDGDPVDVVGRKGFVKQFDQQCRTIVSQRSFVHPDGNRVEVASAWVSGPMTPAERCQLSTVLLAAVVPKLPAPS